MSESATRDGHDYGPSAQQMRTLYFRPVVSSSILFLSSSFLD